jgi:hypothetical protein
LFHLELELSGCEYSSSKKLGHQIELTIIF